MTKEEYKIQQLASRKGRIKRIFGLFGRQPQANELLKKEDAVTPYASDGLFGKGDSTLSRQYADYVYGSYLVKHASKERIREYHKMSHDPELHYAITEIVDEIVQEDEDKKLFTLKFDETIKEPARNILVQEFRDLIVDRLRLGDYNSVWEWVYKLIVQGVMLFKVNFREDKATGVESLEELQPWLVTKLISDKPSNKTDAEKRYFIVKDTEESEEGYKYLEEEVLRVDCGYFYDGEYFSMLEFAKKDWRRLNLIEDATVIYKLSRSPLRRIFKVYVGKMAPKDIERYLYDFRQRLREDITYDADKGEIVGFNPITMLDDYFFPVMEGGQDLCSVDTIAEKETKWESMDEIRYFLGKVYRAMKIPVGRMNLPNGENGEVSTASQGSRNSEVMRDEIKFANFVKRLQGRFMEQFIQELFFRHLFFRGLIDELKLKKHQIQVRFSHVNPYSELKNAEIEEFRSASFGGLNGTNPLMSFTYLAKRYLKWSDDDLRENFDLLKKENAILATLGGQEGAEGQMGGGGMGDMSAGATPPEDNGSETLTETPVENEVGSEVPSVEAAPAAGNEI